MPGADPGRLVTDDQHHHSQGDRRQRLSQGRWADVVRLLAELRLEALRRRGARNVQMRDTAKMIRRRLFLRITDDDLGRSATGVVGRSGFERLLAAACAEEA